jgi:hypothetical protein
MHVVVLNFMHEAGVTRERERRVRAKARVRVKASPAGPKTAECSRKLNLLQGTFETDTQ